MSIKQGGKTIAGAKQYHLCLFDFKWADHILNDVQWLRADTFSWQSGAVYQAAYQHLADDIDGKTLQSETIGTTTIQFYLADDGHKICPASEESNVVAIYNATGVAWYYIIDTVNERFKLPRTKFGVTGLRDTVGNYVDAGLPNITGLFYGQNAALTGGSGAFFTGNNPYGGTVSVGSTNNQMQFNANRSNSIYGNSTTVQPPATQMYLYFYVGNFTQTALENTAGVSTEILNDLNEHKVIAFQTPKAANNYTWYRKYADGWVEQGGITNAISVAGNSGTNVDVTLPITMADTNYNILTTRKDGGSGYAQTEENTNAISTSVIRITLWNNISGTASAGKFWWQVSGMAAN